MWSMILVLAMLLSSCGGIKGASSVPPAPSETISGTTTGSGENEVEQIAVGKKTVYLYIPQAVKDAPGAKVPMVLFMCGTTCDPLENMVDSGWVELAEREGIIVISPDYNNYATYSETGFLISVVKHMLDHYPVDPQRVYSTGFSNGGAASVALTRDYPQYFAAISAMGWMVDLDNKSGIFETYDMPFQVVQGDGEFTVKAASGAIAVMEDEQKAVRSLLLYNEMLDPSIQPNYDETPYWGYCPDETHAEVLNGREWKFCDYYKEGYPTPFAQLVTVEDGQHRCRSEEAGVAWAFFQHYRRDENGQIISDPHEEALPGELNLTIGDTVLTAALADNSSAKALRDILAEGPLTIEMNDFGSMEKVGSIGQELPRNDEPITTEAGDLILYQGNSFVLYYAPNTWNFTRLGKINHVTAEELKELLGSGNVTITLSINDAPAQKGTSNMNASQLRQREFQDLSYGQSDNQRLDLYLPEQGEGPWPRILTCHAV